MALSRALGVLCVVVLGNGCGDKSPAAPSPLPQGNFFTFVSQQGDWIGGGQTYRYTAETANFTQVYIPPYGATVAVLVQSKDFRSSWYIALGAPVGQPLQVGSYARATGYAIEGRPMFSLFGDGRGCESEGAFSIRELSLGEPALDSSPNVRVINRLHVSFEQRCTSSSAPGLTGELRFVAAP
jgi:hypothetical protein